jgi:hypothetical protein
VESSLAAQNDVNTERMLAEMGELKKTLLAETGELKKNQETLLAETAALRKQTVGGCNRTLLAHTVACNPTFAANSSYRARPRSKRFRLMDTVFVLLVFCNFGNRVGSFVSDSCCDAFRLYVQPRGSILHAARDICG